MLITLHFQLPNDPKAAPITRQRLEELVELIREDKEEQALDPAFFTGNLPDYPSWLEEGHGSAELVRGVERFCGCEEGELSEWDHETWYEDLFAGDTWDVKLDLPPGFAGKLTYFVEDEHYGGDLPLAWVLAAAGCTGLKREQSDAV